jgi:hypothetical protein
VHHDHGLGWVPVGLRGDVDGLRDQVVQSELGSLTTCLDQGQRGRWTSTYTAGNPLGQPDVARLVADPARAPDPAGLAAAALAAHNVLAPWVETVQVAVGDQTVLVIDRTGDRSDQPVTDPQALVPHAFLPPAWLSTTRADRDTVLRCSAATPL